jgi:hypothetical protein
MRKDRPQRTRQNSSTATCRSTRFTAASWPAWKRSANRPISEDRTGQKPENPERGKSSQGLFAPPTPRDELKGSITGRAGWRTSNGLTPLLNDPGRLLIDGRLLIHRRLLIDRRSGLTIIRSPTARRSGGDAQCEDNRSPFHGLFPFKTHPNRRREKASAQQNARASGGNSTKTRRVGQGQWANGRQTRGISPFQGQFGAIARPAGAVAVVRLTRATFSAGHFNRCRAVRNTLSNIASVSRPVNVFC